MLHESLTTNREELMRPCRAKVATRPAPVINVSVFVQDVPVRNLAGKGCVFTIDLPRSGGN